MKKLKILIVATLIVALHALDPPSHGAVIEEVGNLRLVEGVLLAKSDLNIQRYLEENTVQAYEQMKRILDIIRVNRQGVSSVQLATLERKVVTNSFLFRQLLDHLDGSFIQRRMNVSDYQSLEEKWRNYVYDAIHGSKAPEKVEGCECPFPECEAPCWRDREVVEEEETTTEESSEGSVYEDCNVQVGEQTPYGVITAARRLEICRARETAFGRPGALRRVKRAWFDLGGLVLNKIFGVATEGELKATNETLKAVHISTHQLEVKSNHLASMIEHALSYIKVAFTKIEGNRNHIASLQNYVVISQLIDEVTGITRHLLTIAVEVDTRIALLKKGMVPPMLTVDQILSLIHEGKSQFMKLDFPFPEEDMIRQNHTKYTALLKALPTEDPHVFLIVVPFVDNTATYNVTKLTPFPTRSVDDKLVIPELVPYLARGKGDFLEMQNLDGCETIDNLTLCSNLLLKSSNFSTCENALVERNDEDIKEQCNFYEVELKKGYYAVSFAKAWYIYFKKTVFATLTCPGTREGRIIRIKGLTRLDAPCVLKTPGVTFGTVQTVIFDVKKEPAVEIPFMKINVSTETEKKPGKQILDQVDQDLVELKHLEKKTSLMDTDWTVKVPVGTSTSSLIIMIICVWFIIMATVAAKYQPRLLPWRRNRMELEDFSAESRVRWTRQESAIGRLQNQVDLGLMRNEPMQRPSAGQGTPTSPPLCRRVIPEEADYVAMDENTEPGTPPPKPPRQRSYLPAFLETTL